MTNRTSERPPLVYARIAGGLYLLLIGLGLFSEVGVRASLIFPNDAATTANHILAAEGLFRAGFLADSLMVISDTALAVLLFVLLRPVNQILALVALCFRLMQTAVITINLLNYYAAILILTGDFYPPLFEADQRNALAALFLDLHSHGYDLGLILFGVHCLVLGYLIANAGYLPKALGYLAMAAGITYLIGSYTRFLFPGFVEAVSPIYGVAIVSELSLGLWWLIKGVNLDRWKEATDSTKVEPEGWIG